MNDRDDKTIIENLMERGYLCLEDDDFKDAEHFFERVLDSNARYAPAYIGKILCRLQLRREEDLSAALSPFEQFPEWGKAYRFASDDEKIRYDGFLAQSQKAREVEATTREYEECSGIFDSARSITDFSMVKKRFENLGDYADSKDYIDKCDREIEILTKKQAKGVKVLCIIIVALVLAVGGAYAYTFVLGPMLKYNNAEKLIREKKYEEARLAFIELGDYKDAKDRINEPYYIRGADLATAGDTEGAIAAFFQSAHYKDADDRICALYYNRAVEQMTAGNYIYASNDFASAAGYVSDSTPDQYKDAEARILEPFYEEGLTLARQGKETEAIQAFEKSIDIKDAKAQICAIYYRRAVREMDAGDYDASSEDFKKAAKYIDASTPAEYSDAKERKLEPYYRQGLALFQEGKTAEAMTAFGKAADYSDAREHYRSICFAEAERIKAEEGYDAEIAWLKAYTDDSEIKGRCNEVIREAGTAAMANKEYDKAIDYFKDLGNDAKELILECHYHLAEQFEKEQDSKFAIEEYIAAGTYSDANEKVVTVCLNEANRLKAEDRKEEAIVWLSKYTSYPAVKNVYQETVYSYAKESMENQDYDKALKLFSKITGFSDVDSLLENDSHLVRAKRRQCFDIPVGGTITFGRYEQDNHSNNGKEPLEWRVLAKDGSKMLVITKLVVESHYFHTSRTFASWDKSNVRAWLNSTFLNKAFTKEEQGAIALSFVTADVNPEFESADPGMDTKDKLFLLSAVEVKKYFSSDKDMEAGCSTYAAYRGASWLGHTLWMTRTPCIGTYAPACVFSDTGIQNTDLLYKTFYMSATGVRPAMWLDFSSEYFMDDVLNSL